MNKNCLIPDSFIEEFKPQIEAILDNPIETKAHLPPKRDLVDIVRQRYGYSKTICLSTIWGNIENLYWTIKLGNRGKKQPRKHPHTQVQHF